MRVFRRLLGRWRDRRLPTHLFVPAPQWPAYQPGLPRPGFESEEPRA